MPLLTHTYRAFLSRLVAPTGLTATADGGAPNIVLTWDDRAYNESGYKIYRGTDGLTWTEIDDIPARASSYTDLGLTPGTQYYYYVAAYHGVGEAASATANATTFDVTGDITWTLWLETRDSAGDTNSTLLQTVGGSAATAASDPIGEWEDESGNGNDFTQATAGERPSLQFVNGVPVVRFAGDFLEEATKATWTFMSNGSPYTIFILWRSTDDSDALHGIMGNTAVASASIGFDLWWDNRSGSAPNTHFIYHRIARGQGGSFSHIGATVQNFVDDQSWGILEVLHDYGVAGDDGEVYYEGHGVTTETPNAPNAGNSTYDIQIGALGNDNSPGNIDIVAIGIAPSILSGADRQLVREYLDARYAAVYGYTRDDFLNKLLVESVSNVKFDDVARLKKYDSNPVFPPGAHSHTWDEDKHYPTIQLDSGTYYMWYEGFDSTANLHPCYATSSDGLTWTRPILGLITYSGNTNNNILMAEGIFFTGVLPDPGAPAGRVYLATAEENGSTNGTFIYQSTSTRTTWSAAKTIVSGGVSDARDEGKAIIKRPSDGRYIAYATRGHASQLRSIRAFISRTTDPTGTWDVANDVEAWQAASSPEQYYRVEFAVVDDYIYAFADIYDNTTELVYQSNLYISRNGLEFELIKEAVLEVSSEWDWGMLLVGMGVADVSDEWRFYYMGSADTHDNFPRDSRVGYATVGASRFGGISGTGEVTTVVLNLTGSLTINADASGGLLEAELLDTDGSVITNYARADFDGIVTDVYTQAATWDSSSPPTQAAKIKFYLTNATLYSYEI
jgi:hypothetical protein